MNEPTGGNAADRKAQRRDAPVFITVAICTRNRASSLQSAAKSVLPQLTAQTELLIIDNGSTDETLSASKQLAQTHPNVRVYREQRAGIAFARNAALEQAAGEYVLFFDDDEFAEPEWFATYHDFLTAPPSPKVACVGGPYLPDPEHPAPSWMNCRHASF